MRQKGHNISCFVGITETQRGDSCVPRLSGPNGETRTAQMSTTDLEWLGFHIWSISTRVEIAAAKLVENWPNAQNGR